ncbi:hypothetical protein KKA47_07080 [bacterium]|nr:hypothetical protein [bacterium]
MNSIPFAQADESEPEMVPEPQVSEQHEFNVITDEESEVQSIDNERWYMIIKHGGVQTLLGARSMTQKNELHEDMTMTDYQFNIHYSVGDTQYLACCQFNAISFLIEGERVQTSLGCCDFEMTYSPTRYNGTVPELDCNISYIGIQVYPGTSLQSTFDLTMLHHIRADWNHTDIKVEALFDFSNTKFYDSNNVEYDAGKSFTTELHYTMFVGIAHMGLESAITPTGYTNTSLEYNLTLDNGAPLTVSKLMMKNNFSIYNETGTHDMMGYSVMECAPISWVTHGFPNLTYKETQFIKSDPEIIVYHDRVTDNYNSEDEPPPWRLIVAIVVWGVIGAIGVAVLLIRKSRRKKRMA